MMLRVDAARGYFMSPTDALKQHNGTRTPNLAGSAGRRGNDIYNNGNRELHFPTREQASADHSDV